jgi:hypothetical protein
MDSDTGGSGSRSGAGTAADAANRPRFDWHVARGDPAREVWYGLVTARERPVVLWFRYTLLSTTGGHREARLWGAVTSTDPRVSDHFGTTVAEPGSVSVESAPFAFAFSGEDRLTTTGAIGSVQAADASIQWNLSYEPSADQFTPLRSRRLTDLAVRLLGTGRHWSANQSIRVDGSVTVGDETLTLTDAPGHQGHTVGTSAPDGWQWVHCNAFPESDLSIEALRTRGRTSIFVREGEEAYRLNRLRHVVGPFANSCRRASAGSLQFTGSGDGIQLDASVSVDPAHWQLAAYRAPDDSTRYVAHCSLSTIELRYRTRANRGWSDWQTVESDRARAEWADTEPPVDGTYRPQHE